MDVAVITASHNPPEYNGFKICKGKMPLERRLQEVGKTFRGNFREGSGNYESWTHTRKHMSSQSLIASGDYLVTSG